ncbi:MAG TPA: VWA domain-containing protein [Sedimenticola thiotaurini]|uniref:VWA domain-containing protein n=1 Tax=Sedimenticola thiotaurini TaxID=1543721 RepID=A0A831W637_9GAMM|nr:VWA domain-containing protein [Sedimenticola thiotaurini]
MSLEFAWPWLFAALPLPLLVAWLLPRARRSEGGALRVPFYAALRAGPAAEPALPSRPRLLLAVLAWLLLVTAAARPQLVGESVQVPLTGRSLMLAVDISGSMENDDMVIGDRRVTRLTAVKAVASDFIEQRRGDHIGLILFGRQAYLQAPLTYDRETVRRLLGEAQVGLAGKETAIGDAIGLAVKRLREQPAGNRVLILLTDGANTAGSIDPLKAADLAAQEGIRIYTIGVGADERIVQGLFGPRRIAAGELDEATLKAIADRTGGRYFRARDLRSLQRIYALLDRIEPISEQSESFRPVEEIYLWPLALALLVTVLLALGETAVVARIAIAARGEAGESDENRRSTPAAGIHSRSSASGGPTAPATPPEAA